MKKFLSFLLAAMMLLSAVALAEPAETFSGYYTPPVINEGQYPVDGDVKLTYWMTMNAGAANFIASHDDNPSYKYIQEQTGVDIEFIHPAAGTEGESFKTLLLRDELPDMIQMTKESWYNGGLQALYEEGVIVDIMPYLEEYAPQYWAVLNENEAAMRSAVKDGKVLAFYKLTYADPMPYIRFNFNEDWLKEFNMDVPVTVEEHEAYFQAVLDNKPGVVPVFFNEESADPFNLILGAYDMLMGFYLDPDGQTVRHYASMPQYKEVLTLLHSWYEKGYISKDFASLTQTEAETMFDNEQIGCIAASVDATYTRTLNHQNFTVTNAPYMRKTEDQVLGSNLSTWPIASDASYITVITTSCENVEAAVAYLNYGYTYEGSIPFSFGIENVHWTWGEDGIPKFTDEILKNPQGMTISNVSYALKIHFGTRYTYPDSIAHPGTASNTTALRIRTMHAGNGHEESFLRLPPISLTTDESADRSKLMAQVNTYLQEMKLRFITGVEPLENFDAYIEEINRLGMTEALEITQGALDRYLGK